MSNNCQSCGVHEQLRMLNQQLAPDPTTKPVNIRLASIDANQKIILAVLIVILADLALGHLIKPPQPTPAPTFAENRSDRNGNPFPR